jgi:sulfite reductase beta subunit-like hemoprotein
VLTERQALALADVSEQYSRGFAHITTRQNIQLHFLKLHDVELVMRRLADEGLTTREACGNSVRNITGLPVGGRVGRRAVRRHAVRRSPDAVLPAAQAQRIAAAQVQDRLRGLPRGPRAHGDSRHRLARGRPGRGRQRGAWLRVAAGGGTATMCRSAAPLHDFLPVTDMFASAEAIVRVFHKLGDYKHKHKNRMKFLIKSLGWERLQERVRKRAGRSVGRRRAAAAVRS